MTITLPARCDRASALEFLPELIAAGSGTQPIAIDASGVAQMGQAMLQLLVSARRTAPGAVIRGSDALREAAALAGLDDELFAENDL